MTGARRTRRDFELIKRKGQDTDLNRKTSGELTCDMSIPILVVRYREGHVTSYRRFDFLIADELI